jgi:hypothetical protein
MASKKDLKKDINYLTEEVIQTCYLQYYLKQNKEEAKAAITQVIEETVDLRNNLINKLNHPEMKPDNISAKRWHSDLLNVMIKHAEDAFEKLEKQDQ